MPVKEILASIVLNFLTSFMDTHTESSKTARANVLSLFKNMMA